MRKVENGEWNGRYGTSMLRQKASQDTVGEMCLAWPSDEASCISLFKT